MKYVKYTTSLQHFTSDVRERSEAERTHVRPRPSSSMGTNNGTGTCNGDVK